MESGHPRSVTFAAQMDLVPDPARPGRYEVDVSAEWNCPTVPQGGIMAALAARAMQAELAGRTGAPAGGREGNCDGFRLRTLTTVFAAPVPAGPVEIDVTVLRRGRSMSQLRADVHSRGGDAGHSSVAVFGRTRAGFEFTDATMPEVPSPHECPSFRDDAPEEAIRPERPEFPFWDRVEGRPALGHAPWDDWVPTTSECATWFRFDTPPVRPDGSLDPLALVTLCDTMPGAVGERMGPGTPWWLPPSTDLTVHLLAPPRSEWLLAQYRAHHAGDGYASTTVHLWDPATGLVALGTQVMYLVFPNGPPTGDQRFPADQRQGHGDGPAQGQSEAEAQRQGRGRA